MFIPFLLTTAWFSVVFFIWLLVSAFKKGGAGWGVALLLFWPVSPIIFGIRYWRDVKIPFLALLLSSLIFWASFIFMAAQIVQKSEVEAFFAKIQQGETFTEEQVAGGLLLQLKRMAAKGVISQGVYTAVEQEYQRLFPHLKKESAASQPAAPQGLPAGTEEKKVGEPPQQSKAVAGKPAETTAPPAPTPAMESKPVEDTAPPEKPAAGAGQKTEPEKAPPRMEFRGIGLADAAGYVGKRMKVTDQSGTVHLGWLKSVRERRLFLQKTSSRGLSYAHIMRFDEISSILVEVEVDDGG